MNEGQLKISLLLMQAVDWSLLIAVFSIGIYGVLYSENKVLMGAIALAGLLLVNRLGVFTIRKMASMRVELDKLKKLQKH